VDLPTERNAVLLFAVLMMLLFSPLAWQMAYVWPIVPLALLLASPPPDGHQRVVLLLGMAAVLLGMRMWTLRVLDMTNIIGGGLAVVCLMLYYLPLELPRSPCDRGRRRPETKRLGHLTPADHVAGRSVRSGEARAGRRPW
jgi:hypothetical protein